MPCSRRRQKRCNGHTMCPVNQPATPCAHLQGLLALLQRRDQNFLSGGNPEASRRAGGQVGRQATEMTQETELTKQGIERWEGAVHRSGAQHAAALGCIAADRRRQRRRVSGGGAHLGSALGTLVSDSGPWRASDSWSTPMN
jgi:hypothetical protein